MHGLVGLIGQNAPPTKLSELVAELCGCQTQLPEVIVHGTLHAHNRPGHRPPGLVPKKALVYDADQLFIFRLLEDDTVERLLIQARLEDRDNIEPVGILQQGDRIIIAGQASLKDGSKVRLVGTAAVEEAAEESAE